MLGKTTAEAPTLGEDGMGPTLHCRPASACTFVVSASRRGPSRRSARSALRPGVAAGGVVLGICSSLQISVAGLCGPLATGHLIERGTRRRVAAGCRHGRPALKTRIVVIVTRDSEDDGDPGT